VLASAKDENEVLVDSELAPKREVLPWTLFWLDPLLKHLAAADEAENGCFLLIKMRCITPGIVQAWLALFMSDCTLSSCIRSDLLLLGLVFEI
jgi:hypothetical protein